MRKLWTVFCVFVWSSVFSTEVATWSFSDVNSGWNSDSLVKMYFHHSEMQRQWAWELLGRSPFTGYEKILDFGCGDGKISAEMSHLTRHGKVVGVDISKKMIHFAHIHFPPSLYPSLEFRESDSLTLADLQEKEEYDMICSFAVFHLVADPLEVLKNLKTNLKPEGKILLVIPAGENPVFYQAATEMFVKYNLEIPWATTTGLKKTTMRTLEGASFFMREAGYSIESIELINKASAFYDLEDLIAWMIGTITANWKIPVSMTQAFCSNLVHRMYELNPSMIDEEGRVHFGLSRICVIAHPKNKSST